MPDSRPGLLDVPAGRVEAMPPPRPSGVVRRCLRIAVLSYNLPRPGFKRGGIERVAHDLADGLARRGHQVTVHSHDPRPEGAAYAVAPLPWRHFVTTWAGRRLTMGYLGNVLASVTRFGDVHVIMAHGDSLLLSFGRTPVLRVMHGSALDEARTATSLGRRVLQFGVYGLELVTALTHRHCVAVSANTRRRNPFIEQIIPNGVNRDVFHPDPNERAPVPTVVFVGALAGRKRGAWLLEQFSRTIRPRAPGAELHMVCEPGPAVPGVTYHTGLGDEALASLYRRAWVCAAPSTYEGFGLPYLEAMASGTPVVATANAGSVEVLGRGRYGRLAPDAEFGDAVCDFLIDRPTRDAVAAAGLRRAAELGLDRTLDAYESLLQSMVTSRA